EKVDLGRHSLQKLVHELPAKSETHSHCFGPRYIFFLGSAAHVPAPQLACPFGFAAPPDAGFGAGGGFAFAVLAVVAAALGSEAGFVSLGAGVTGGAVVADGVDAVVDAGSGFFSPSPCPPFAPHDPLAEHDAWPVPVGAAGFTSLAFAAGFASPPQA